MGEYANPPPSYLLTYRPRPEVLARWPISGPLRSGVVLEERGLVLTMRGEMREYAIELMAGDAGVRYSGGVVVAAVFE